MSEKLLKTETKETLEVLAWIEKDPIVQGLVIGELSTWMGDTHLFSEEQEASLKKTMRNLILSGIVTQLDVSLNPVNWTYITRELILNHKDDLEEAMKIGFKIQSSSYFNDPDDISKHCF
jgi:hypothetical protein